MTRPGAVRPRLPARCAPGRLVVVDGAVRSAGPLPSGLRDDIEVLHLEPGHDAWTQIAASLEGRRGLIGLHILCHGEPGTLLLAGERIDLPALAVRRAALKTVAAALVGGGRSGRRRAAAPGTCAPATVALRPSIAKLRSADI